MISGRLVFHVPGKPISQGSMILRPRGGITHSNPALPFWRATVAEYAMRAANDVGLTDPLPDAVGMRVDFVFQRPSFHFGTGRNADRLKDSAPKYPIKPPDLDKLVRAILDAVSVDARILADDSQVVWVQTTKTYASPGQSEGVLITIGVMP